MEKEWYQSKTILLNLVLFLLAALDAVAGFQILKDYGEQIAIATVILNLILRYFFTDTGISR